MFVSIGDSVMNSHIKGIDVLLDCQFLLESYLEEIDVLDDLKRSVELSNLLSTCQ